MSDRTVHRVHCLALSFVGQLPQPSQLRPRRLRQGWCWWRLWQRWWQWWYSWRQGKWRINHWFTHWVTEGLKSYPLLREMNPGYATSWVVSVCTSECVCVCVQFWQWDINVVLHSSFMLWNKGKENKKEKHIFFAFGDKAQIPTQRYHSERAAV